MVGMRCQPVMIAGPVHPSVGIAQRFGVLFLSGGCDLLLPAPWAPLVERGRPLHSSRRDVTCECTGYSLSEWDGWMTAHLTLHLGGARRYGTLKGMEGWM